MLESLLAAAPVDAPSVLDIPWDDLSFLEIIGYVLTALFQFIIRIVSTLLPWLPLIAWVSFWLLAVDWKKYRETLANGGVIGILLIGLCMILIWGLIAPPADGAHYLFGLTLSNFVGKTVYVTALFCIMFLCGSVQLSGCCSSLCCFSDEEEPAPEAAAH